MTLSCEWAEADPNESVQEFSTREQAEDGLDRLVKEFDAYIQFACRVRPTA